MGSTAYGIGADTTEPGTQHKHSFTHDHTDFRVQLHSSQSVSPLAFDIAKKKKKNEDDQSKQTDYRVNFCMLANGSSFLGLGGLMVCIWHTIRDQSGHTVDFDLTAKLFAKFIVREAGAHKSYPFRFAHYDYRHNGG